MKKNVPRQILCFVNLETFEELLKTQKAKDVGYKAVSTNADGEIVVTRLGNGKQILSVSAIKGASLVNIADAPPAEDQLLLIIADEAAFQPHTTVSFKVLHHTKSNTAHIEILRAQRAFRGGLEQKERPGSLYHTIAERFIEPATSPITFDELWNAIPDSRTESVLRILHGLLDRPEDASARLEEAKSLIDEQNGELIESLLQTISRGSAFGQVTINSLSELAKMWVGLSDMPTPAGDARTGKQLLVLWNSGTYADELKKELGSHAEIVTSQQDLSQRKKLLDQFWGIVVLLELTWEQNQYAADFYGNAVAQRLRNQGVALPVLFVTLKQLEYFKAKPNAERFPLLKEKENGLLQLSSLKTSFARETAHSFMTSMVRLTSEVFGRPENSRVIILWNRGEFSVTIGRAFGDWATVVCSEEDLFQELYLKPAEYGGIVVLMELRRTTNDGAPQYTDFRGAEVAKKLRIRGVDLPILFTSFLPLEYFLQDRARVLQFSIVKGRGSRYLHLPWTPLEVDRSFNAIRPLTSASMKDVVESLCDVKGLIQETTHDMKGPIGLSSKRELEDRLGRIGELLTEAQKLETSYQAFCVACKNAFDLGQSKVNAIVTAFEEKSGLVLQQIESAPVEGGGRQYQVLVVEDDDKMRMTLKSELERRGLLVLERENAIDALETLVADVDNNIVVVVADWRLIDAKTHLWQQMQGYEFLDKAAQSNFVATVALTSLNHGRVHNIRNSLGSRIELFKKEHLVKEAQWNVFVEMLKQRAEEIVEVIGGQPIGTAWTNSEGGKRSYREQYQVLRGQVDWPTRMHIISSHADKLWVHYSMALEEAEYSTARQEAPTNILLPLDKHGMGINGLQNFLIVRRIWLALWASRDRFSNISDPTVKIYEVLKQKTLQDYISKLSSEREMGTITKPLKSTKRKKGTPDSQNQESVEVEARDLLKGAAKVFKNSLAITTDGLPEKGLLPEERSWLNRHGVGFADLTVAEYSEAEDQATLRPENEPTVEDLRKIEAEFVGGLKNDDPLYPSSAGDDD